MTIISVRRDSLRKRSRLEYGPERPAFLLLGALFALAVAGCGQPPLRAWTEAAARMTRGESAGEENSSQFMPPDATGEALGLSPARLTLTFGFSARRSSRRTARTGSGSRAGGRRRLRPCRR